MEEDYVSLQKSSFKKAFKIQWKQLRQSHAKKAIKWQFLDLREGTGLSSGLQFSLCPRLLLILILRFFSVVFTCGAGISP